MAAAASRCAQGQAGCSAGVAALARCGAPAPCLQPGELAPPHANRTHAALPAPLPAPTRRPSRCAARAARAWALWTTPRMRRCWRRTTLKTRGRGRLRRWRCLPWCCSSSPTCAATCRWVQRGASGHCGEPCAHAAHAPAASCTAWAPVHSRPSPLTPPATATAPSTVAGQVRAAGVRVGPPPGEGGGAHAGGPRLWAELRMGQRLRLRTGSRALQRSW